MLEAILLGLTEYRASIHLVLHVLVPALVALILTRSSLFHSFVGGWVSWKSIFVILMLTMAVDIDHIVAEPIYSPGRCSIWFHPFHTLWPIIGYVCMTLWPIVLKIRSVEMARKDRIIGGLGLGLVIHMLLDWSDCLWMKAC